MQHKHPFSGTGVAMVTPFDAKGEIDYPALQRLTEHLIGGGIDYLVVHGTTGEAPVLSVEEKRKTIDFILEVNAGRLPVVIGIGGNNTRDLVKTIKGFDFKGIAGILSSSPGYSKPTQEGIYQHFKALSAASPLPIILYNVPGRTASNMEADTTLRLARDFENIVAIKEASNDLIQIMKIVDGAPKDFAVVSGDDGITAPLLGVGVKGLISVVGNAYPQQASDMVSAGLMGDNETLNKYHRELGRIIGLLFADGNPAGIKEVLAQLNICDAHLRLPLVPVTAATKKGLAKVMKTIGLIHS